MRPKEEGSGEEEEDREGETPQEKVKEHLTKKGWEEGGGKSDTRW